MRMNFEIIDNADIGSRYHINRIIRNEIKIIEIGEFDYDFVIIYFIFGKQEDAEIIELLFINFLKCFVHVPFFRRMSTVRTRDAARAPVQSAIQSYMEASRPGTKIW